MTTHKQTKNKYLKLTSLHDNSYRASNINAITPETTGVANDVPCPESSHLSTPSPAVIK